MSRQSMGEVSRAVLVTGCSSGTGRATALALIRAGLPTWASARRLDALGDLEAAGCRIVQLDVTDEESRARAVRTVEAEDGAVGALVNNAGYAQAGPVEDVSLDLLRRQFETNVFGLVRMCQLVLPGMRAQRHGTIVNMGSAAGLIAVPASSAYDMTKWSLEALSDALRCEVRRFGVRVVLLEPGGIATGFSAAQAASWPAAVAPPYQAFKRNHQERVAALTRPGERGISSPEDVASVVVKAITRPRPRARYKVGVAPRVMPRMYRWLPSWTWDAFMRRLFPME
jgi:NAD(P)-dependent dehydrogenase (short-subunit alcohol dehydrogenase family)